MLENVEMEYRGSTEAGTEIVEGDSSLDVAAIYDTGIAKGVKSVYDWKLKEPVTLEAGKTSIIVLIVEGKEYPFEIKCTTEPEEGENAEESGENTDTETSNTGRGKTSVSGTVDLSSLGL